MLKIAVTTRFIKQDFGGGYYYVNNANVRMFNDNNVILIPVTCKMEKDFILDTCDGLFVPPKATLIICRPLHIPRIGFLAE